MDRKDYDSDYYDESWSVVEAVFYIAVFFILCLVLGIGKSRGMF